MKNKVIGLVMLSMGFGMLLVLVVPGWGFVLAGIMASLGYTLLFCKKK